MTNETVAILLFIVSEAIIFGALFAQYFYARALSAQWPPLTGTPEHFLNARVPAFPLPLILTIILVVSGFTAHFAQTAIRKNDQVGLRGWLAITIVLGVIFLAGQVYEYAELFREGLGINTGIYGSTFFTLTGMHGLHVTGGVILLAFVLARAAMDHFTPDNHFAVEGSILYWHFVDIVWLLLYVLVYIF